MQVTDLLEMVRKTTPERLNFFSDATFVTISLADYQLINLLVRRI
jgi:hypothetical protein